MKAWPPRLSRPRMVALLALVLVGAGSAWWMLTGPPELRLRTIIEPPEEFRLQLAEIQGFSPDGSILVIEHKIDNDPRTLILRHARSGRIEKRIDSDLDETIPIESLDPTFYPAIFHAFSPDGSLLAVWLDDGNVIRILDTATWEEKTAFRQDRTWRCRFFPDGKALLIQTMLGFTVWDVSKGERLETMEKWCDGEETRCWISPDGRELKAVLERGPKKGEEDCVWQIGTWDGPTWALRRQIERAWPGGLDDFEIAPDGRTLARVEGQNIVIEDIESGNPVTQLQLPEMPKSLEEGADYALIKWSADGRHLLITGDGMLWLWDIKKPAAVPMAISFGQSPICSSADGKLMGTELRRPILVNSWILRLPTALQKSASWCFGEPHTTQPPSRISLRDMSTGDVLAQATLDIPWVVSLAFSPDGSTLAASDSHGRILLYDVPRTRKSRL